MSDVWNRPSLCAYLTVNLNDFRASNLTAVDDLYRHRGHSCRRQLVGLCNHQLRDVEGRVRQAVAKTEEWACLAREGGFDGQVRPKKLRRGSSRRVGASVSVVRVLQPKISKQVRLSDESSCLIIACVYLHVQ